MNTTAPSRGRRIARRTVGIALAVVGLILLATAPFLSEYTSETADYETEGYAVVGDPWDYGDSVIETIHIEITPDGDGPVFAGFATPEDAEAYLDGIQRTNLHRGDSANGPSIEDVEGGAPAEAPGEADIWIFQAEGTGARSLDLDTEEMEGELVPIVMNPDGTARVAGEVTVEYEIPSLPWVITGLIVAGLLGLGGGVWLVVRGRRRA